MAYIKQNSPRPLLREEEPLDQSRGMSMNDMKHGMSIALLVLALPLLAMAQDDLPASPGTVWGKYTAQQSVEFGGRLTGVGGSAQVYDTLVNLKSGPRLFGQELTLRPLTHGGGGLFDSLYLSSFGFGGDPNDMARLRVEKSKYYNFVGLYRRDENYFDYNLFANPLNLNQGIGATLKSTNFNPTTMPWYANSPHLQNTTRNMGDFDLTLFPQSAIRIRLGYARNVNAGRLDTTLEGPIRSLLTEYSQSRSDRYQFGIDVRVLPRTTLSFDQFFEHDKVDPNFVDNNLSFNLGSVTGAPIDIGLFLPPSGCTTITAGVTYPGSNVFVPNPKATAKCLGTYLYGFNRSGAVRTYIPTSQLSLQSNYFRKLDITASGTYSSGESDLKNYNEFANYVSSGLPASTLLNAVSHTDRVSGNADLGLTYHINRSWSVSDKFRWLDWRNPGNSNQLGFNCTATPAPGLTQGSAGCTTPNVGNTNLYQTLMAERTYYNTAKLNWAPNRRVSAYLGYRYGRRELTGEVSGDSPTLNGYYFVTNGVPDGPKDTTKINENAALGGIVLRPTMEWRINADLELMSADNAFTNIGPRHQQRMRFNTVYKVNRWASVNGGVHFVESRNDLSENVNASNPSNLATPNPNLFPTNGGVPAAYGHKDHWRYYTMGASLNPNRMLALDFGWTYLDQLMNSASCVPVAATGATSVTVQVIPAAGLCNGANAGGLPLTLDYQERTNTAFANIIVRPVHRVALNFGYELTSTAGRNRWLLPGGVDGTGNLLVKSDVYGNSPPVVGNPITPCPSASTAITGGCAFAGPFPDAPFGQGLNWHKPTAGIAVDVAKNVTFKGIYSYYDYNDKETQGLPLVTAPRNFHANTGTVSLKYAF